MYTETIVAEMRVPDDNRGELPSFFMTYRRDAGTWSLPPLYSLKVTRLPFGNSPATTLFYYESTDLAEINRLIWQTVAHTQFVYTRAGEKLIKQN